MQQIHVSRYSQPTATGYQGSIMPADGSWIVFVTTEGTPQFFRRAELKPGAEQVEHGYVNVLDLPREAVLSAGALSGVQATCTLSQEGK